MKRKETQTTIFSFVKLCKAGGKVKGPESVETIGETSSVVSSSKNNHARHASQDNLLKEFKWLCHEEDVAFCNICKKISWGC
jgi:hypothetical protein